MKTVLVVGSLILSLLSGASAYGFYISSASDPNLGGGTVITFDSTAVGTQTPLSIGNVSFSSAGWRVANDFAGLYNSRGLSYLDNNAGNTQSMTFTFAAPVSAFGFLWGASDTNWVLSAYDAQHRLLETHSLPVTYSSNAGDFVGLADAGIASATLTNSSFSDWVFVDNFTYVASAADPVPEPSTLVLLGAGLAGMVYIRRRKSA